MELKYILRDSLKFLAETAENFTDIQLFLFGSASRNPDRFNDIDVLILYTSHLTLKIFLESTSDFEYQPLLHFTCISVNENLELQFLENEKAIKIEDMLRITI